MSKALERVGVGGAQLGLDYGITNSHGMLSEEECAAILLRAASAGMVFVDTAPAYGTSELAIGKTSAARSFRVVSKTVKVGSNTNPENAAELISAGLLTTLSNLRTAQLDSVLVHDASDLLGPCGSAVWSALERARDEGRVRRIGVSIYDGATLDQLLDRYPLDIVQVPVSALDRRLLESGRLERVARSGVAIHARSIFLQGLVLADVQDIPAHLAPLRQVIGQLDSWGRRNRLNRLEAALWEPLNCEWIECCVIGVTSVNELDRLSEAAEKVYGHQIAPFRSATEIDAQYLDPSIWTRLQQAKGIGGVVTAFKGNTRERTA